MISIPKTELCEMLETERMRYEGKARIETDETMRKSWEWMAMGMAQAAEIVRGHGKSP